MASVEPPPDGISDLQIRPRRWSGHASPLAFIVLAALIVAALSGVIGGGKSPTVRADSSTVTLRVTSPAHIRNGEIFETRITVNANSPVEDLRIALPPSLWRDLTINSLIPAATEERFADGLFQFHYGPLEKGERLEIKVSNQINPALIGRNQGEIIALDGHRGLVRLPLTLTVLP